MDRSRSSGPPSFVPPSFARLRRRRRRVVVHLGPVVGLAAETETGPDENQHRRDDGGDVAEREQGEVSHGASLAIALGDALGEAADASPRVGAPGLAGGRSDGDGG